MPEFKNGERQPGVHVWDLPELPDPAAIDTDYYTELMLRAVSKLLQPFGLSEQDLCILTHDDLGVQLDLPIHAWRREHEVEFFGARLPSEIPARS